MDAGATLAYPAGMDAQGSYLERLREDASPSVGALFPSNR